MEHDNLSSIIDKGDGTIQINGDSNSFESMNFISKMTLDLASPMGLDLDMLLEKRSDDTSKYKAIFGNLPVSKMTEDKKISPMMVDVIKEKSKEYNPNVDYMETLARVSPEISKAFEIIDTNLLNKEGFFQFALKNGKTNHDMSFRLGSSYSSVTQAFNSTGISITHDSKENGVVIINNTNPGEQILILDSVNEELKKEKLDNTQAILNNGMAYVKKMEDLRDNSSLDEAASVNPFFLITVIIAEVLLIGFFLFIIFTR